MQYIPQLIKNVKDSTRSFALISTYGENRNGFDNGCRHSSLKRTIRNDLKLGHYQLLISRLVEIDTTPKAQMVFDERAFMIYGVSLKTALELGGKYNQLSIVFKSGNRCDEICASPFDDRNGRKHGIGDTIRSFEVDPDDFKNMNMMKEIFETHLGGLTDRFVNCKYRSTLYSVYDVEDPSPSVFAVTERFHRIF